VCKTYVQAVMESAQLLSELPVDKLLLKKKSVISELAMCNQSDHPPSAAALVRPLEHMRVRGVTDTRRTLHGEQVRGLVR